jgi:hypothetical protein
MTDPRSGAEFIAEFILSRAKGLEQSQITVGDVAFSAGDEAEAAVDGVPVIGAPGAEMFAPFGAADGDEAVVGSFGFADDGPGVDGEGGHLGSGARAGDGVVGDAGDVGDIFVEFGAALGGEVFDSLDVEAEAAHEAETVKFAAEVFGAPVGVGASAMWGGDCDEGLDVFGHVEFGEHVTGVESAEGVGDEDYFLGVELGSNGEEPSFELAGAAYDAGGGMDGGDEDAVAGAREGAVDAFEGGAFDGTEAEITVEEAVM